MHGRIKIVRVGQLTGDTENGIWNMSEAWPLMLSTAKELKCLPVIKQRLDWLPLDVAARAVVDLAFQRQEEKTQQVSVYHVVNSTEQNDWEDLLRWLKEIRDESFEVVEPGIWLDKLEALESHPAKKLLWLWEKAFRNQNGMDSVELSVNRTMRASKALREFIGVDEPLTRKIWAWLEDEIAEGQS